MQFYHNSNSCEVLALHLAWVLDEIKKFIVFDFYFNKFCQPKTKRTIKAIIREWFENSKQSIFVGFKWEIQLKYHFLHIFLFIGFCVSIWMVVRNFGRNLFVCLICFSMFDIVFDCLSLKEERGNFHLIWMLWDADQKIGQKCETSICLVISTIINGYHLFIGNQNFTNDASLTKNIVYVLMPHAPCRYNQTQ